MIEKIYSFEQIEHYHRLSLEQIKRIVKFIGIVPAYVTITNKYYFSEEQVRLIIENNPSTYDVVDEEIVKESKMNY